MLDAVLNTHGLVAYLAVLACLIAGALGLPVPEDLALITAGVLVHLEKAEFWLMLGVCYVGIITGDLVIFRIGWMAGPALFRQRWVKRFMNSKKLHSIRVGLERKTFVTIVVARHLFYLRTATFLVCGSVRMSFVRFFVADAIAALITAPLMVSLGYIGAQNYDLMLQYVKQVKTALLIGGVITFSVIGMYIWKRRDQGEDDDASPVEGSEAVPEAPPPSETKLP